ncbi:MucR family transcriptional regulator [Pantoea endophytica]
MKKSLVKIQCLECGKCFDFLAPHLRKAHQMSAFEYRDRWNIPRQQALASISHRATCRANIMARINRGELCPDAQIEMMRQAYKPRTMVSTPLHKSSAGENARRHKNWLNSPVINPADSMVKKDAIRRMKSRTDSGELVKDIAKDLNLSVSRLYAWLAKA